MASKRADVVIGIAAAAGSVCRPPAGGSGAAVVVSMMVRVRLVDGSSLPAGENGVALDGLRPSRRSRWLSGSYAGRAPKHVRSRSLVFGGWAVAAAGLVRIARRPVRRAFLSGDYRHVAVAVGEAIAAHNLTA